MPNNVAEAIGHNPVRRCTVMIFNVIALLRAPKGYTGEW
jgi:hypothetical protein